MVGTTSVESGVPENPRKTFGILNLALLQLKIGTLPVKNDANSHVTEPRDIVATISCELTVLKTR